MLVDANVKTWLLIGWKGTSSWTETMIWNLFNQGGLLGQEGALKMTYSKVTCKCYHEWSTNFSRWWLDTINFSHFLLFVVCKLCANKIYLAKSTNNLETNLNRYRQIFVRYWLVTTNFSHFYQFCTTRQTKIYYQQWYWVGRTNKSVSCMVKDFHLPTKSQCWEMPKYFYVPLQGSVCVWVQPMDDVVTLQHHLTLAEPMQRQIPALK